jgi:hypothetical protein
MSFQQQQQYQQQLLQQQLQLQQLTLNQIVGKQHFSLTFADVGKKYCTILILPDCNIFIFNINETSSISSLYFSQGSSINDVIQFSTIFYPPELWMTP